MKNLPSTWLAGLIAEKQEGILHGCIFLSALDPRLFNNQIIEIYEYLEFDPCKSTVENDD